MTKSTPDPV